MKLLIHPGVMADLDTCGGYLRVKEASIAPSGVITSPNYPNNYAALTNCIWLIEVDEDKTVDITIDTAQGEVGVSNECIDYLEVKMNLYMSLNVFSYLSFFLFVVLNAILA